MIEMRGPGGPDGCSVFNCLDRAVQVYIYTVAHPCRDVYDVRYKFCKRHDEDGNRFHDKPHMFPTHTLKEKTTT